MDICKFLYNENRFDKCTQKFVTFQQQNNNLTQFLGKNAMERKSTRSPTTSIMKTLVSAMMKWKMLRLPRKKSFLHIFQGFLHIMISYFVLWVFCSNLIFSKMLSYLFSLSFAQFAYFDSILYSILYFDSHLYLSFIMQFTINLHFF